MPTGIRLSCNALKQIEISFFLHFDGCKGPSQNGMNIGVFKSLDCRGCLDSTLSRGDRGVSKFCSHNSLMVPDAKGKKQTYLSAKNIS